VLKLHPNFNFGWQLLYPCAYLPCIAFWTFKGTHFDDSGPFEDECCLMGGLHDGESSPATDITCSFSCGLEVVLE
jgi:hypothetical protein